MSKKQEGLLSNLKLNKKLFQTTFKDKKLNTASKPSAFGSNNTNKPIQANTKNYKSNPVIGKYPKMDIPSKELETNNFGTNYNSNNFKTNKLASQNTLSNKVCCSKTNMISSNTNSTNPKFNNHISLRSKIKEPLQSPKYSTKIHFNINSNGKTLNSNDILNVKQMSASNFNKQLQKFESNNLNYSNHEETEKIFTVIQGMKNILSINNNSNNKETKIIQNHKEIDDLNTMLNNLKFGENVTQKRNVVINAEMLGNKTNTNNNNNITNNCFSTPQKPQNKQNEVNFDSNIRMKRYNILLDCLSNNIKDIKDLLDMVNKKETVETKDKTEKTIQNNDLSRTERMSSLRSNISFKTKTNIMNLSFPDFNESEFNQNIKYDKVSFRTKKTINLNDSFREHSSNLNKTNIVSSLHTEIQNLFDYNAYNKNPNETIMNDDISAIVLRRDLSDTEKIILNNNDFDESIASEHPKNYNNLQNDDELDKTLQYIPNLNSRYFINIYFFLEKTTILMI